MTQLPTPKRFSGRTFVSTGQPPHPTKGDMWLDTDGTPVAVPYLSVVTKGANYTATDTDAVIICTATCTITLPTAASSTNKVYHIKNVSAAGTVTVDGNGAETIDGSATKTLATQYGMIAVISDGTEWWIIASL